GAGDVRDALAAEAEQVAHSVPGPAAVVAVDVHHVLSAPAGPAGPAAEHGGDARALDEFRQRVGQVQGEHQRAVDVSAGQVAADPGVVVPALGQQQDELVVVRRQLLADAAQLPGEEGVGEDPGLGLGDDDGDGVVAFGD